VIGGAGLNPEVENFLAKIKFPLTNGYGMTECAPLISYTDYQKTALGSVGQVVDRMEVKINSPDPEKMPGEILTRGENVMWGYYKNEEATKETIDDEGWLHTGDIGVMDKDGFLYIKGRYKSMLLGPSGKNIYPEEIEVKLNNMPYVSESIVLQHKDKLAALVHPDLVAADADHLTEKQLSEAMEKNRKQLNEMNPGYMHVTQIKLFPEEFEKTPKKTVKRFLYTFPED
jgi:long-chain acyl-CoA synthetase